MYFALTKCLYGFLCITAIHLIQHACYALCLSAHVLTHLVDHVEAVCEPAPQQPRPAPARPGEGRVEAAAGAVLPPPGQRLVLSQPSLRGLEAVAGLHQPLLHTPQPQLLPETVEISFLKSLCTPPLSLHPPYMRC